ncbi:MAG: hypothetical protein ACREC0_11750 [Methylocella sp.]
MIKTGHRALIAGIGGEAERVVFEPTGHYHRAFERALAKAGRQARQGQPPSGAPLRGGDRQAWPKTDRLDAALDFLRGKVRKNWQAFAIPSPATSASPTPRISGF